VPGQLGEVRVLAPADLHIKVAAGDARRQGQNTGIFTAAPRRGKNLVVLRRGNTRGEKEQEVLTGSRRRSGSALCRKSENGGCVVQSVRRACQASETWEESGFEVEAQSEPE